MRNKKLITSFSALILATSALTGGSWAIFGLGDDAHNGMCASIEANASRADSAADLRYRQQEAKAAGCDISIPAATPSAALPSASASAAATATATPTAAATSPTATPTASATEPTTDDPAATDSPTAGREVTFYASADPASKVGVNAYGPAAAQDPALGGMNLEGMSAAQFLQEMGYRIQRDPMLAASFYLSQQGEVLDDATRIDGVTQAFLADHSAWDAAVAFVNQRFAEALESGVTTQHFGAGWYATTYAIPGNGMAYVRTNASIWREGQAYAIVGGVMYRYECGGQPYWASPADVATTMPPPTTGMSVDEEGTPIPSPPDETTPDETTQTTPDSPAPEPTAPLPAKSPVPNADGVVQPNADTTTVDGTKNGQGPSSEPAHGADDMTADSTDTTDTSESSDGNTSELSDQGSAGTGATDVNTGDPVAP